jgi:hypothetical protein
MTVSKAVNSRRVGAQEWFRRHDRKASLAREALLIGNEAYTTEIGRLSNPHNDVALLEQALKGLRATALDEGTRPRRPHRCVRGIRALREVFEAVASRSR